MPVSALAVAGIAWIMASAPAASAQEACSDGRIAEIRAVSRNVFEGVQPERAEGSPSFAEKLSGTVHVPTRESFLRSELLFQEGDCFDSLLLSESERNLRAFDFIATAVVSSERMPDGSHRVSVETQDDWSLSLSLGISFDEGLSIEGLALTESNLLGRGVTVSAFRRERRESRESGGLVRATKLLGTRFDTRLTAGKTRVGEFFEVNTLRPFVGEIGRFAARGVAEIREDYFSYSAPDGAAYSQAIMPTRSGRFELTFAGRVGEVGGLTLLGAGLSAETLEYQSGLEGLELVMDNDFTAPVPSGAVEQDVVAPQVRAHGATRLNVLVGRREVRFVQREGLDAVSAVQDVLTGWDAVLTVGRSLPVFEAQVENPANDVFTRLQMAAGRAPGNWVLGSRLAMEGRRVFEGRGGLEGWRDVLGEAEVNVYHQPDALGGHTLYGRIWAAGGWSTDRPFQLTLGGRDAVRGYSQDALPGGRMVVGTFEDRITLGWPGSDVVNLGVAFFGDVGQSWAGDAPFGVDSGWRSSVGAGLRIGMPGESDRVVRLDFTYPLTGDRESQGTYFRMYAEVLGLLDRRNKPDQMERSRWLGIEGDLATRSKGR